MAKKTPVKKPVPVDEGMKKTMLEEWQKVRKKFYYPQIPPPELTTDVDNGQFDLEKLQTKISPDYIKDLETNGIVIENGFNETFTHEINHFMAYPGSFLNVLRLHKAAGEVLTEKEKGKTGPLVYLFNEVQNNMDIVLNLKHPDTAPIHKVLAHDAKTKSKTSDLINGLYQKSWGYDLEMKPDKEQQDLIEKLEKIDFPNKRRERLNVKRFVEIMKDYSDDLQNMQFCSSANMFSDNQIKEGIRQFAQEVSNPQEFEETVKQVLQGMGDKDGKGKKAGVDKGAFKLANNFYTALAEGYSVPIKKMPRYKSGSLYPHSHEEFGFGDAIDLLDPYSSPGVLPGITKKWVKKENETHKKADSVPDLITCIDNSGSMTDPNGQVSLAVLGATVVANAYLDNGSKVGVYNFGGDDKFTEPTDKKDEVHKELRYYTGGGTTFTTKMLVNFLKEKEKPFDVSIVSDMDISNLDELAKTILEIPKTHRVHLIYTSEGGSVDSLRMALKGYDNAVFLPLINKKDINKITMGELKNSVK